MTARWIKKYFLGKLWNVNYSWIERFYRSKFVFIGNGSTKSEHFRPIWTRIDQNSPWLANLDTNRLKWPVIGQFGPQSTKTDPNWLITGRFGQFDSKLTNHGPLCMIEVQIDQSRAVLVDLGPNWPITGRFGQFGPKLANHGPFWSVRAQID